MKLFIVSLVAPMFVFAAGTVLADYPPKTFTICKGELAGSCRITPNFKIGCKESETPIIERECTVVEDGKPRVRGYVKNNVSTKNGDQCGYTVWEVTCSTK